MMTLNRRILGLILIALGASVWLFYAGAKAAGMQIEIAIVLIVHLSLVIPGAILAPGENIYGKLWTRLKRTKGDHALTGERGQ